MRVFWGATLGVCMTLATCDAPANATAHRPVSDAMIQSAADLIGLEFTPAERAQLLEQQLFFQDLTTLRESYASIREGAPDQSIAPALHFLPAEPAWAVPERDVGPRWSRVPQVTRPDRFEDVAFWSVASLGALLRSGQATSVELTELFLGRLERHDPQVELVVSLLADRAFEQAQAADQALAAGQDLGPLHGIPYVLKDLFAVEGTATTWGAAHRQGVEMAGTATVARRLEDAGAVLLAKVSLGALAWGDVWFGGRTRNPWNLDEGSSGSSAGSAAAVSAGLAPFSIGTETWGSIVGPSARTGVTGLRPTFGRVSRAASMAVSWSMDKAGPICRYVEDCGMVLDAIRGTDGIDRSVVDVPFNYQPEVDWSRLRIGYVAKDFEGDGESPLLDRETLDVLRGLGADLVPIELPDRPVSALSLILAVEAAASFDEITRSGDDDQLTRQIVDAWPNVLRTARLIPGAEYVQANRIRTQLGQDMREIMSGVDVYLAPAGRGDNSLITNLTGHPAVAVPNGFTDPDSPNSITFIGRLYDEATLLAVARAYQSATDFHSAIPPLFDPGA